jgi:hypothetical protein
LCLRRKNGSKSSVTYESATPSTGDGILDQPLNALRGGPVSSGRSMSIDLKCDRRVGVTNSITESRPRDKRDRRRAVRHRAWRGAFAGPRS